MGNIFYTIALILLIVWSIAFFGYNIDGLVHLLLVVALIALILRLVTGRKI